MGLAVNNPLRGCHGIVFRQAKRCRNVVCRAHRDIAYGWRTVKLHEPSKHLAERAVSSDAGNGIKAAAVFRGKARCIAPARCEIHRRHISAGTEDSDRFGKAVDVCAAARHRVDNKHQILAHGLSPCLSFIFVYYITFSD